MELTFSTDDQRFGEFVTIDLKENGRNIPVTDENKAEYVQYVLFSPRLFLFYNNNHTPFRLLCEWRIRNRVQDQLNAFIEGFHEMIPKELVNVFDERELELLIGGISEIDMDDWKKHTDYRSYKEDDEVIIMFWKVRHFLRIPLF